MKKNQYVLCGRGGDVCVGGYVLFREDTYCVEGVYVLCRGGYTYCVTRDACEGAWGYINGHGNRCVRDELERLYYFYWLQMSDIGFLQIFEQ